MTHRIEQVETEWHRQTTHVGMWPCQAEHVNTVSNLRKCVWSDSTILGEKEYIHMAASKSVIKVFIYKELQILCILIILLTSKS